MTDAQDWTIYATDGAGVRVGVIDFAKAELLPRYNDIGEWALDGIPYEQAKSLGLLNNSTGIEATQGTTSVLSGPTTRRRRKRSVRSNSVDLSGPSDEVWMARRVLHPQPGTPAPPYSVSAYDIRTGQCSTLLQSYVDVNAGPGALPQRRVPGLTIGPDPGLGPVFNGRARWAPLIDGLTYLAAISRAYGTLLGWRLRARQFQVYAPVDRSSSVIFSVDTDTISDFEVIDTAPDADFVYAGGTGDLTARLIAPAGDSAAIAEWGLAERFVDQRNIDNSTELAQAATAALADKAATTSVTVHPIDGPSRRFGTDYDLGDIVTVVLDDGATVVDVVAEAHIAISENGVTTTPTIGTTLARTLKPLQISRVLRSYDRRIVGLESA